MTLGCRTVEVGVRAQVTCDESDFCGCSRCWGVLCCVSSEGRCVCPGSCCALCGLLGAQWGLHGDQAQGGGGGLAALSFCGNSRAEPGNTVSGRKATAARRE